MIDEGNFTFASMQTYLSSDPFVTLHLCRHGCQKAILSIYICISVSAIICIGINVNVEWRKSHSASTQMQGDPHL